MPCEFRPRRERAAGSAHQAFSCALTASSTRAEYTSAAPAFSATATPSASAISSWLAPCFSASAVCTPTRYGLLTVAATSSAIALQLTLTALGLSATLGVLAGWFE